MAQWFRLYESVLDDPKVQRLKPDVFRAWINMLALASRHDGHLPEVTDIGFALRVSEEKAAEWAKALYVAGLLDRVEDGTEHSAPRYSPHNWASRQFKSDVSNEWVKRFRERQRNVTETPSDTESDTEQNRTEQKDKIPRQARKTKLPDDWAPTEELLAYAAEQGCPDPKDTAERFRLHHQSKGSLGSNWSLGFQFWCRNEKNFSRPQQTQRNGYSAPSSGGTVIDDEYSLWRARLRGYTPDSLWLWGPRPGEAGCQVPAPILAAWRAAA